MFAILQPFIPHYREEFINGIIKQYPSDVYVYENSKKIKTNKYNAAKIRTIQLKTVAFKSFLLYNPLIFYGRKYSTLILMLHIGHISTWLLLLTKCFHRKKIILWGHGISVKRYIKEEKKPDWILKLMIRLTDAVWLYTSKEKEIWQRVFPNKKMVALGNTVSGIEKTLLSSDSNKEELRRNHQIQQDVIFIFCARFSTVHRRVDLLVNVVERLDPARFGFIIIGDGPLKPDFSIYPNIYDYGAVYDDLKNELFCIADIYFQPAWVGLSIVEAMAHGKPIFTFERSVHIKQCVEYNYIQNDVNGFIFKDLESLVGKANTISKEDAQVMGLNAKQYVVEELSMQRMCSNAIQSLELLEK